jgi:hypothetical protein
MLYSSVLFYCIFRSLHSLHNVYETNGQNGSPLRPSVYYISETTKIYLGIHTQITSSFFSCSSLFPILFLSYCTSFWRAGKLIKSLHI